MTELLTVENLHTQFQTHDGIVRAVDGVSFTVDHGEIVGVVGESGCGKSVTARSIVGLEDPGEIVRGSVQIDGTEVTDASPRELRRLRGDAVSMVFQDPTETLNPVFDIGEQIAESLKVHDEPDSQRLLDYLHAPLFSRRSDWREKRDRAVELMEAVGIASPDDRVDAYPHELSGGMRQRAGLAIALASEPDLLIADEPTTALDTTTQAQILERLRRLNDERGLAMVLISHDIGVVADICDRIVVMYAGEVMETGPTERILEDPRHPYTRALLECLTQESERKSSLPTIDGSVPDLLEERPGCSFAPRCPHATDSCRTREIPHVEIDGATGGTAACAEPIVFDSSRADGTRGGNSNRSMGKPFPSMGETASSRERSRTERAEERSGAEPLVECDGVSKRFDLDGTILDRILGNERTLTAVSDIDLEVRSGKTLGLVGESGSGKSTLAGLVAGLETPTTGEIRIDSARMGAVGERSAETLATVGYVFQNPKSSINPRMTVEAAIAEPMRARGWSERRREERVVKLLDRVGLASGYAKSYPHELSGGQIQRVAIARAIALDPDLLVLDEPVSALDISVQARILNLLLDLQDELGLTYLLISHDLDVVEHVADRIAVMYLGELMEVGPAAQVFGRPTHPYTEALLEAIPSLGEASNGTSLEGEIPSPVSPPSGCAFHTRCPRAQPECATVEPDHRQIGATRSACHVPLTETGSAGRTDSEGKTESTAGTDSQSDDGSYEERDGTEAESDVTPT
ncbi:dipeptide ABC transporter ATP-binding protein [Halostagnicola bangensis]